MGSVWRATRLDLDAELAISTSSASTPRGVGDSSALHRTDNAAPLLGIPEADARISDAVARSPLFASALSPIIGCNGWSAPSSPVAPLTAPGAPPLLVIAGTHDQRTPTRWGVELAESLDDRRGRSATRLALGSAFAPIAARGQSRSSPSSGITTPPQCFFNKRWIIWRETWAMAPARLASPRAI